MVKRILVIAVLSIMIFQSTAFALDTEGGIIFKDTLYGTAIGAILGTAIYLVEQDGFAQNVATGVLVGAVGGLIYGFVETDSFVEIKKDEIKIAVPTPVIQKKNDEILYSASLFKTRF